MGSANTWYGYFIQDNGKVFSFTENITIEQAEYIQNDPDYLWDTGILLDTAGDYLHEFNKHSPEAHRTNSACAKKLDCSGKYITYLRLL